MDSRHLMYRKLTRNYLLALGFLALLAVTSFYTLQEFLQNREADAYMINISGQQRYLTQRIALLGLELVNEQDKSQRHALQFELQQTVDKLEENHKVLEENKTVSVHGITQTTARYHTKKIKTLYYDTLSSIDKKIHYYIDEARSFASASDSELVYANPTLQRILAVSPDILDASDTIVNEYKKISEKGIQILLWTKTIVFVATLLALALVGVLLFRPMVQDITTNLIAIEKKEEELQQLNNELEQRVETRTKELVTINQILIKEITAHQQTAEQLKILTNALEQTEDFVVITDAEGITQYVNKSFERFTGYSQTEIIGKSPSIVKSGMYDAKFYGNLWKTLKSGNVFEGDFLNKKKNGELYWEKKTITPIKIGSEQYTHFVSTGKDITEQIKAEELIKEVNLFNQILLRTIPLGMQVVGMDGTVLFINEQLENQIGKDAVGKKCWEVILEDKTVHAVCPVQDCPVKKCSETSAKAKALEAGEIRVVETSGLINNKTAQIYYTGIEYNKQQAVLEIFVDISKLKDIEQKLIYKNKELNSFIYRSTHDLRGPLVSILGLVNIAISDNKDVNIAPYLNYIKESTLKLDAVLLDFVQVISIKENKLNPIPLDLKEMVGDIVKTLQYTANKNKVSIRTNISNKVPFHNDYRIVQSLLQNLIENAIKYSVGAGLAPALVSITIHDHKQGVLIKVEDNGMGMNKETQAKAFDMFFRGTSKAEGTGLGLYIVHSTVEKLKGTIELKSEENKGTAFTIYLPDLKT